MKSSFKFIILIIISILSISASLLLGTDFLSIDRLLCVFKPDLFQECMVLNQLRVPRVMLAFSAGAALSVSGAVFQALFRNALAEPYILGVSGGAAFGTAAGVIFFQSIPVLFFSGAGSFLAVISVYIFSLKSRFGSNGLILSGMSLSFILSSAVLLLYSFSRSDQMHKAVMWMLGDFSSSSDYTAGIYTVIIIILCAIIMLFPRHLNIISFGENFSKTLGISKYSAVILFFTASACAAVTVSAAGVIGFVGLIVPHIMRKIFTADHRILMPASFFGGGIFLSLSDALGRFVIPPYEIPAGIVTGFIGGIFFLVLTLTGRRGL
jgi:iron complex transport system permease protein